MRKALRGDIMKGHFASPLTMEEMSIEDMLLEIPTDDLRHVGTIKDRIYMRAGTLCAKVGTPHYPSAQSAPTSEGTRPHQAESKQQCCIPSMTNRSWISTDPPAQITLTIKHYVLWWHMPKMIP
jgi:hypothetical protein